MKKILKSFKSITKTQTIKDSIIVMVGMGFSTIFSALSIFLIARILGPADFGLYTTALIIVIILIDSFDLAIGGSIVNFASQKTSESKGFIKYGFNLKLYLGLILGVLFALISRPLAGLLHPQLKLPLLISASFIPVIFLVRFPRSLLQAQKKFLPDSLIEVAISLIRLLLIGCFYWFFKLTVINSLLAYLFGAVFTFIFAIKLIPWDFLKAKITHKIKTHFFSFQKWLTVAFILAAIHSRIDTAILMRLAGPTVTGIYQAGFRFFMPAIQFAATISLVFAPRFASFPDNQTAKKYLHKAAGLSLGLGGLVLLIIPIAQWLIQLIFGSDYSQAVLPTQILSLGFAAFVAGAPFSSHLIYFSKRIKAFFAINLLQLIMVIVLNLILVPLYGAVGAALSLSLALIIVNSLMAGLALSYKKP